MFAVRRRRIFTFGGSGHRLFVAVPRAVSLFAPIRKRSSVFSEKSVRETRRNPEQIVIDRSLR